VRRLNRDDAGITMVIVTVGMAALLLMAALGLDVGGLFFNKARAQNSADARALAAAINCAHNKAIDTAPLPALQTGESVVLDISSCAGHDQVTSTVTKSQDFQFLPQHVTINRHATATWSGVGAADTLPITLSECDFQRITAGGMPTGTQTVYFHSEPVNTTGPFPCNASSSGLNIPGGFGWISGAPTGSPCIVHVTLSTPSDQGNSPPSACNKKADWDPRLGHDYLIPIYGATDGHSYTITGFAELTFQGYKWNGGLSGGTLNNKKCPDPVTGADMNNDVTCLQGSFKKIVTNGTSGGYNFGAVVISLIK
jgi:Putative Flp pilus-assembly TadE/G-like